MLWWGDITFIKTCGVQARRCRIAGNEEFPCKREDGNHFDPFAVAACNGDIVIDFIRLFAIYSSRWRDPLPCDKLETLFSWLRTRGAWSPYNLCTRGLNFRSLNFRMLTWHMNYTEISTIRKFPATYTVPVVHTHITGLFILLASYCREEYFNEFHFYCVSVFHTKGRNSCMYCWWCSMCFTNTHCAHLQAICEEDLIES